MTLCTHVMFISLLCILINNVSVYYLSPPQRPPGASLQSWDVLWVSVGTLPGLLHPSEGWGQPASPRAPCHQVPSRTSLVLMPLGALFPMTKLRRRRQGWRREGRKEGRSLSICAGSSGLQGLLLTLIPVATAIRPDQ